jgi:Lon protease-like protein
VSLVAVGTRRIVVEQWLDDDPFPRALVRDWPDDPGAEDAAPLDGALDRLEVVVREVVALAEALGASPTLDDASFSDDPTMRTYQLATVSPLGAHDRLRVLCEGGLAARVSLLEELVEEQRIMLEARRAFGDQ